MAKHIDSIAIALRRGKVVLPWSSRAPLLGRLSEESQGIREAFEAVGASVPVRLTNEQKAELAITIDAWANTLEAKSLDLPEGVWNLRNELRDDLNDAAKNDT
jgi:hypothetical protein